VLERSRSAEALIGPNHQLGDGSVKGEAPPRKVDDAKAAKAGLSMCCSHSSETTTESSGWSPRFPRSSEVPVNLHQFDVVKLLQPQPGCDLPVGAQGAIVLDHFSTPPAYEVEFVDAAGNTTALLTVLASELELVQRP
jgi:uncharacterized protein DUF4926